MDFDPALVEPLSEENCNSLFAEISINFVPWLHSKNTTFLIIKLMHIPTKNDREMSSRNLPFQDGHLMLKCLPYLTRFFLIMMHCKFYEWNVANHRSFIILPFFGIHMNFFAFIVGWKSTTASKMATSKKIQVIAKCSSDIITVDPFHVLL